MAKSSTSQGGEPAAPAAPAAAPAPAQPVVVSIRERDEFVTRLIGRHGSTEAALANIAGEQLRYRKRAQRAEADAENLRKQVPAAGSVVLSGDEAKAYTELKGKKGFDLTKVSETLDQFSSLQETVRKTQRAQDLTDAAGKKYNKQVLEKLLGDTPVEFKDMPQMKADKSGIETVRVPYVVLGTGDKAVRELLDTYLDRDHKGFKEVLMAKEGGDTEEGGSEGNGGVDWPKQTSGAPPVKGKDTEITKLVDTQLNSTFMSPSARRKAAGGAQ